MEGVGARGVALKLFVQLLGCSRSGGAVVRAGAAEPSGTGRSASSGREEPQSEEGEEEEEKEEERGPRWRLGSRKPGSWTGDAAVCTDSAPAARAPQALARASAPGGRGARLGAEESGPPRSPSRRGSASRAGPGRASETMNFLLSWVHWSLALLLYLHHAKVSRRARLAPRAAASASPGWGRACECARGGSVPHAGPWAPGARLRFYLHTCRGRGRALGGRTPGQSLTAHAGPAHPPELPHVGSGPTSGGREPEEAAEGAGLALPLAAEVCSRPLVPDELEVRAAGAGAGAQRAGVGVLGPWTGGGQRAWRRQGAGERGACCHCRSISAALASSWGKVLGWIAAGTPPLRRATCAATPPPVPARVPLGARPPPPGRARAARSRLHQPGPGRPRVPGAAAARAGNPGWRAAPLPPPALRGKVTSRGSPLQRTRRTTPIPSRCPQPLTPS